jgi:hypothetical protein
MVRTVLSLSVSHYWHVHQLDVKNVFLYDTLSKTVYCSQPTRFVDPAQPDRIRLLNKSVQAKAGAPGLIQSVRHIHHLLRIF